MISATSVICVSQSQALVGLALPALALGVPIFDTLFSMLRRFLERRSVFAPDRSHFHHRLVEIGLNQRQAVLIIYAITFLTASSPSYLML
jgi:UDP-GlcNAc:undecaprenyl-phosphate GlcNAc-1-phosphate transferase